MRAFLAIEIEEYIKENINKTQQLIKDTDSARINYVKSDNIHLTIKFFGDIDEDKKEKICDIVNRIIVKYKTYQLKLVKVGAFRNINNPRVIWAGIKDNNVTMNLIKELDEEFSKIGFEKERNYTPHITIGRVKNISDRRLLTDTLKRLNKEYFGKMTVKEVSLKSSVLTPNGPIYDTVEKFSLGD